MLVTRRSTPIMSQSTQPKTANARGGSTIAQILPSDSDSDMDESSQTEKQKLNTSHGLDGDEELFGERMKEVHIFRVQSPERLFFIDVYRHVSDIFANHDFRTALGLLEVHHTCQIV
jgi:hypothetical protein